MPLPPLDHWDATARALHRAVQPLKALRLLVREHVPNYLELATRVEPFGLTTDTLPSGAVVALDFGRAAILYRPASGAEAVVPVAGHTLGSLFEATLATLAEGGERLLEREQGATHTEALVAALDRRGFALEPMPGSLTGGERLEIDPRLGADYARALYRIFTASARFRARLSGPQTPLVVWPEHFDLSTLWFATEVADERGPHMNFGFAPFSDDLPRPYLYVYGYPMPAGFETLPLPAPARWHTAPWQGAVLDYDDLRVSDDPEATVERLFEAVYRLLAPSLTLAPAA